MCDIKKICAVFLISSLSLAYPIHASDVEEYKKECAELGFKIGTKANANCAVKLLQRRPQIEVQQQSTEVAKAHREAEQKEFEYQQSLLLHQQQQMYELQRRAVAAQEQAAQAQQQSADSYRFNNTMQMLMGTGAYARPQPRTPITCTTTGAFTTCD